VHCQAFERSRRFKFDDQSVADRAALNLRNEIGSAAIGCYGGKEPNVKRMDSKCSADLYCFVFMIFQILVAGVASASVIILFHHCGCISLSCSTVLMPCDTSADSKELSNVENVFPGATSIWKINRVTVVQANKNG